VLYPVMKKYLYDIRDDIKDDSINFYSQCLLVFILITKDEFDEKKTRKEVNSIHIQSDAKEYLIHLPLFVEEVSCIQNEYGI
jgi:hypothetical protein